MELSVLSLWAENLVPGNIIHLRMGDFIPADVKSLMFVMLVFTGQANVYLVRERHHVWNSVPSRWMLLGTLVDVLLVSHLASQGILVPRHLG